MTLHGARDLPALDLNGSSDPYVIMRVNSGNSIDGEERVKSRTIKKNLNPNFEDAKFILRVPDSMPQDRCILSLHVWDWDLLSRDDYIGCALVDLTKLPRNVPVRKDKKLDGRSGSIQFTVEVSEPHTSYPYIHLYGVNDLI